MNAEERRILQMESELASLRDQLRHETEERIRAEEALQRREPLLTERVKEISCVYSIIRLMMDREYATEEQRLQDVTNFIPTGWQDSPDACVELNLNGRTYRTGNYRVTPWRLQAPVTVHGEARGSLVVGYVRGKPDRDEGPFLYEEKALIEVIALLLGGLIGMREPR